MAHKGPLSLAFGQDAAADNLARLTKLHQPKKEDQVVKLSRTQMPPMLS